MVGRRVCVWSRLVIFEESSRRLRRILPSHLRGVLLAKILRRFKAFERPDNILQSIARVCYQRFFCDFTSSSVLTAMFISYTCYKAVAPSGFPKPGGKSVVKGEKFPFYTFAKPPNLRRPIFATAQRLKPLQNWPVGKGYSLVLNTSHGVFP